MKDLERELVELRAEYERILLRSRMVCSEKIPYKLRTSLQNGRNYYYLIDPLDVNKSKDGKYLSVQNRDMASDIANYDYSLAISKELEYQIKAIDRAIKNINPNKLSNIYDKLSLGRKELVTPLFQSDEEYAKEWQATEVAHKDFQDGMFELYSERGERVRSKSEKIIADKLYMMGIPYRYETAINLKGLGTIHPDFTVLDVKNRKEIYWEHLGMMDNPEYTEKAIERMNQYARNDILVGDKLILTFETSRQPLDIRSLDKVISAFL